MLKKFFNVKKRAVYCCLKMKQFYILVVVVSVVSESTLALSYFSLNLLLSQ